MKILIAEDEAAHRDSLAGILSKWPEHEVTFAADGLVAWTLLSDPRMQFDLVFLDVKMPKLGGLELLQRLRESASRRSAKFVMCSSVNDRATISKAILMGVKRYIIRPCSEAVVAEMLRLVWTASASPVAGSVARDRAALTASA